MFNRTKPCNTCPFRTGENGLRLLGRDRAREIAYSLLEDGSFSCHDDIDLQELKRQHCAGAVIVLEKLNRPNQMMRIAERLRLYDRNALSGKEEVFDDFEDWIDTQSETP